MTFSKTNNIIIYTNSAFAYIMNFALIYLIVRHTKKHMGKYHYLLFAYSVFNVTFPTVHLLGAPTVFIHDHGFLCLPTGWFRDKYIAGYWMMLLYASFFSQSHVMLMFHFLYRFFAICKPSILERLHSAQAFAGIVVFYISVVVTAFTCLNATMNPPQKLLDYINPAFTEHFNFSIYDIGMIGINYKYTYADGTSEWDVRSFFALLFFAGVFYLVFFIILYCAIRIITTLKRASMSPKTKKIQTELFQALVIQTLIPLFLEYIPALVAFGSPLFALKIDTAFVTILKSLYPAVEPAALMYFVRDYRHGFLRKIRGNAYISKVSTSNFGASSQGGRVSMRTDPTIDAISTEQIKTS